MKMSLSRKYAAARPLAVFAAMIVLAGPARADVYTVGPTAAGCHYTTIQQAIDKAQSHAGADTVRITRAYTYTQQAITVNASEDLNIVGGFADCAATATDNGHTTVSGTGGAQAPVFRISVANGARVKLRHLDITGGDNIGYGGGIIGYGGGIYFTGGGTLEIMESTIAGNHARYGGGLYAKGTGALARLEIGAAVLVGVNEVTESGGGIYADSVTLTMTQPGSAIFSNRALNGYGGGLKVLGDAYPGTAYLASGGALGYPTLGNNAASYGGGLAIEGRNGKPGKVYLYTTQPTQPAAISGNDAILDGGGVYAEPGPGAAAQAILLAWNANIEWNTAKRGSAVYLLGTYWDDEYAPAHFNFNSAVTGGPVEPAPAGSVKCAPQVPCNRIHRNVSRDGDGVLSDSTIRTRGRASFALRQVSLRENEASNLLFGERDGGQSGGPTVITDSLIADNTTTGSILQYDRSGAMPTRIDGVTIAGNSGTAGDVLTLKGRLELKHSIIWQPGKTSLSPTNGTRDIQYVLASETASLGAVPTVFNADPRFVDAEHGNYRLQAASPAVDVANNYGGTDLTGAPRGKDLVTPDVHGPSDLGAYERQTLAPLIHNGHFDQQLQGWQTPVFTTWSTENAPGGSAGGSAFVDSVPNAGGEVFGGSQCVFLPTPGTYALSGFGRAAEEGQTQADRIELHWIFRRNGGPACTSGTSDRSGTIVLSETTQWHDGSALISVPANQWTPDSSIVVYLQVTDRGVDPDRRAKGWFDAITLDYVAEGEDDTLFRNGFD